MKNDYEHAEMAHLILPSSIDAIKSHEEQPEINEKIFAHEVVGWQSQRFALWDS